MRILLLADSNSVHIIKWARALSSKGLLICIVGFSASKKGLYVDYPNVETINLGIPEQRVSNRKKYFSKLIYLSVLGKVKQSIRTFNPDIVHAHYATSYGLLGALSGFQPFILSVWGSDVFIFPKRSFIHKVIFKYNLNKATRVLSTSEVMAREIALYYSKSVEVTPFGIDLKVFRPQAVKVPFEGDSLIIGTVKTLEKEYGIEYLIEAFKIVSDRLPHIPLRLLIVGGGSLESSLKQLVKDLEIEDQTLFIGKIPYEEVPSYHNMMDISVFLSNSESFGVSVIEASACEKPVVVSDVGGLPEVVEDVISGYIVPSKNPMAAAQKIQELVNSSDLRKETGQQGRVRVKKLYDWQDNVAQLITIYENVVEREVDLNLG